MSSNVSSEQVENVSCPDGPTGQDGGHRKRVLESHRAFIVELINQTSHLTLHGLKAELAGRGVEVSHDTVWKFLRREGLRFKKTLFALEQARADIARRRRRWRSVQPGLDPRRLVFIDETWIKTNMAPLRGWGPRGKRQGFKRQKPCGDRQDMSPVVDERPGLKR